MFAKDKVSQSLIDAVNKVITKEEVKQQLNEAFPTVADAQKRASEPKPSGGAGIKLGTRYGGGRQADEPEKDDEPKARAKYGARKDRFTNTKLYKEAEDCVDEPKAKEIAKKEVGKHEKSMHKEELKGNQHKIDANKNGKIDAHDFELLRSKKKKMTEGYAFAERLVESMYGKKSALPIDEKEMSDAQKKKKEDIVMSMKKDTEGLKKRYGSRWKEVMYATATKQAMKEDVEVEEEIDPDVRTKDALTGANKPTNRKDDVGPGADGRSSKVKFKGGPMNEEKEDEKEDEGHEDEKEDKALVKKMVKKDALKEEEQLDELSKNTLSSYLQKRGSMISARSKNNKGNENMAKAVNKMSQKVAKEEVEQIDELSHGTLRSYVDKAKKENLPGKGGNRGVALLTPGTRDKGVHRAVDRMKKMKANEENELYEDVMTHIELKRAKSSDDEDRQNVHDVLHKGKKIGQIFQHSHFGGKRWGWHHPATDNEGHGSSDKEEALMNLRSDHASHTHDAKNYAKDMAKVHSAIGKAKMKEEVELDETSHMNKPKKLKSFMSMKKEMIGKAGMTSEKKDEE